MNKEERDLFTIVTYDLDWHPKSDLRYIMVMEVLVGDPYQFYMAHIPPVKYRGHNKMKYYRQILN